MKQIDLKKEMAIRGLSVKVMAQKAQMAKSTIYTMMADPRKINKTVIEVLQKAPAESAQFPFTIGTGRKGGPSKKITVLASSFSQAFRIAADEWRKEGYEINEKNTYTAKRGARIL